MDGPGDTSGAIGSLAAGPLPGWAVLALMVVVAVLMLCLVVCCVRLRCRRARLGQSTGALDTSHVVLGLNKSGERPAPPPPQGSPAAHRSSIFHMDSWERWRGSIPRKSHAPGTWM